MKKELFLYEKRLFQITDLYEDLHVTKLPQLDREVRGPREIEEFSEHLVNPYVPNSS